MNYAELDSILRIETTSENHILDSIKLYNYQKLTDADICSILYPILHCKIENNILILNDNILLPKEECITISKHHRFIKVPNHQHNFIELVFVYSGICTQVINGKSIILNTGEMCILDTNVIHSIESATENDIIINCLMRKDYFDTSLFSRISSNDLISNFLVHAIYQSKNYNNYIVFKSSNNIKILDLMRNLMCEYYDNSICSKEIIDCYIILIFSELLKVYNEDTKEVISINKKSSPHNIANILSFIEKNYINVTLTSTAEHFNFHPNYLSSLLKKTTGKSFKDVIHDQKLKKSCSLLKNTNLTIEDISIEIGYNNLSFFYKKFKASYGVTPQEYRRYYNKSAVLSK